jgi:inosose dehydratase
MGASPGAHSNVAMQLATAPVSWGVWEATIDRADLVAPERLIAALRDTGYSRLELGPPGYFGATPDAAAHRLHEADLTLVGAFVPLRLTDADGFREDQELLASTLATLARFADDNPMVLLADAGSPERVRAAGQAQELRRTALENEPLRQAADRLVRAAESCRDAGLRASFHHHAESYFEAPDEVERLLDMTDVDLLGVCFDTGHGLIGGGDPLELMRAWAPRITHIHLKDVDPTHLDRLRAGRTDMESAWEEGLFCPFGNGAVDFPGLFGLPEMQAFGGVVVLEQDRVAVTADDLSEVAATEAANLDYIVRTATAAGVTVC